MKLFTWMTLKTTIGIQGDKENRNDKAYSKLCRGNGWELDDQSSVRIWCYSPNVFPHFDCNCSKFSLTLGNGMAKSLHSDKEGKTQLSKI